MKKKKIKKGNKIKTKEWEGGDDCEICRAMESGEADSLEGLKAAFDRANKKGSKVGGALIPIKIDQGVAGEFDLFILQKEVEEDVVEMLKECGSRFSLEDVKVAIYNEEESDDMMKVVAMFDRGGEQYELQDILNLVTDAWNYFPHKALNGLSPSEMLKNADKKNGKNRENN